MYANLEDLRAEEELNIYPPRFKISVNRLSHGQKLDTEFKIVLENDGALAVDEVKKFPLIITKLVTETPSGKVVSMLLVAMQHPGILEMYIL